MWGPFGQLKVSFSGAGMDFNKTINLVHGETSTLNDLMSATLTMTMPLAFGNDFLRRKDDDIYLETAAFGSAQVRILAKGIMIVLTLERLNLIFNITHERACCFTARQQWYRRRSRKLGDAADTAGEVEYKASSIPKSNDTRTS